MTHPLDAADLRDRVQRHLDEFLDQQEVLLLSISPALQPMMDALREMLSGGKRLRPAFCYWGYRAAGGKDSDAIMRAAASLELLQACALIHDDLMDGSDTRRGLPAIHRRMETLHEQSQWHGSPSGFGAGSAILLGDLCLSWADEMLMTSGLPTENILRTKTIYDVMRTELMAGQYLDLLEQATRGTSVDTAMTVVTYKSAKYSIERPLHIGALLAGCDETLLESLSGYGLPLGAAFQLRDDVLGVFGDPSQTGKPAGDDLREGKRTVMMAVTVERASDAQRADIERLLGQADLTPEGVEVLRQIIIETGALATAEETIEKLLAESLQSVSDASITNEARDILITLAHVATRRSA